ncbi:hypothetical protein [Streptomyces sp. CBMA156]|uniref:hypothetical protein n=1 Tax=Streptomyces sp. CBMA156 TaxID=1930280 RepID=UPI001661DD87|nr:hypothetical protein [Streptomyces sp. CBMA156]
MVDIGRIASAPDGPVDWRLIADIAGACHRIPGLFSDFPRLTAFRFAARIADGWTRDRPAGRVWVRERSAKLPYWVPRSVRRTLELPERADLGDPLSLADARALVRVCAEEGVERVDSVARSQVSGFRPPSANLWPENLVESEYVVSVASVTHQVRLLCSRGPGGSRMSEFEVMARVWASADEYGRHWLTFCCWEAAGGLAPGAVSRLAEEYGPAVPSEEVSTGPGRRPVARWCEDIVLAALVDARRLASVADGPVEWQRIADILGVCSKVAFPPPDRRALTAFRYPGRLAGRWPMTTPAGWEWARERSVGLPYRVPRSIRRTLEKTGP